MCNHCSCKLLLSVVCPSGALVFVSDVLGHQAALWPSTCQLTVCELLWQTSFAAQGVQRRGDTSAWTDTPAQRLQRLQRNYEQDATLPPATTGEQASAATMQAIEGFNAEQRGKTLLEQHQAKLQVCALYLSMS